MGGLYAAVLSFVRRSFFSLYQDLSVPPVSNVLAWPRDVQALRVLRIFWPLSVQMAHKAHKSISKAGLHYLLLNEKVTYRSLPLEMLS